MLSHNKQNCTMQSIPAMLKHSTIKIAIHHYDIKRLGRFLGAKSIIFYAVYTETGALPDILYVCDWICKNMCTCIVHNFTHPILPI